MTTEGRRVALVTGANKGIGRAIVAGLANQGFVVYLGARDTTRGERAAAELRTHLADASRPHKGYEDEASRGSRGSVAEAGRGSRGSVAEAGRGSRGSVAEAGRGSRGSEAEATRGSGGSEADAAGDNGNGAGGDKGHQADAAGGNQENDANASDGKTAAWVGASGGRAAAEGGGGWEAGAGDEAVTADDRAGRGEVRFVRLDVTSSADIAAAVQRIRSEVGRLDVLVNNAGVSTAGGRVLDYLPRPTEETAEDLRFVYATNVFAVVSMINGFLPLLRRSPAGRIVNVTSMRGSLGEDGAWVGQPDMAYSSSKTALNAITVHYARELAGAGIKVNGAAPGHVATDFNGFRGIRSPEQGAAVAIRLATLGAEGPTGAVFQDDTRLAW